MSTEEKEMVTHVMAVIDMSGSMSSLASDVRGGFNTYVAGLRDDTEMNYRMSVTVFDTYFISLGTDLPLDEIPEMTAANYAPRGMTALNDAIGRTIMDFEEKHGKLRKHERALVVIYTDGVENASRRYTTSLIKEMIAARQATKRWGFLFLGAGLDAFTTSDDYGIGRAHTIVVNQTSPGTNATYSGLIAGTHFYASGQSASVAAETVRTTEGVADEDVDQ